MLPRFSTYQLVCLTVLLGLLASNCGPNKEELYSLDNKGGKIDSILSWIDRGRDKRLDRHLRIGYLIKAERNADGLNNDSLRTVLTSKISFSYLTLRDSIRFYKLNAKTIDLAQQSQDSVVWAEALWDRAIFFNRQAITDSAFYNYSQAQKLYEKLNRDFESARMLYNMALAQAAVRDYTGSEINTIQAIEIFKPLEKSKQLYYCYSNLGSVTKELKDYERAVEYYNTAFQYLSQIEGDNHYESSLNNNIGVVYQEQGRYEESLPYFEKVLEKTSLKETYPKGYALALNHWAYSKFKADPEIDVSKEMEQSIRIMDSLNHIPGLARAYYNLAEYHFVKKDTVQAIVNVKKSKEYAQQADNNERILLDLQLMAKLEPEKASAYTKEYISLNDSLQQIERQIRNKFARIRFETDEFIAENLLLARQKQLWTGIAVAVLLLGIMSYFILDQRVKNQKLRFQQEQQAANQEIFNLMLAQNQKIEEGKKLEQKRISEELHDGVLGRMLGARMVLTGLNKKQDEEAQLQRKKAIDALQDVEKEIRAISHELSHAAYQKINNFIRSIEDLLETVKVTGNFNYTFDYDKGFDYDGIKGVTKINIYRLIQESLQNCVKHANCENVSLKLSVGNKTLTATIKDDGKGFAIKKGKKGIGMRNMASRIEKLKGQWHIESTPGKGTSVSFEIPLTTSSPTLDKERVKEEELT